MFLPRLRSSLLPLATFSNIHRNKLPKRRHQPMAKPIRLAHETWQHLDQENNFRQFMRELLPHLQNTLQLIEVHSGKTKYNYYSCGQPHDPENPLWRPFKNLKAFCRNRRLDFEVVKCMLEERLFKRLQCECEILTNRDDIRRKDLQSLYGLDFGEPGKRELDIA